MASRLGIGAGIGIPFRNIASGGGKPYLSPEVKEALKAVVIAYGKTNNDSDRAIVKNLVDASNPFVISNAAYTEGSGYADKDSPYYGAFVTDGIDDLITSTKTVQEMLGGSNEITVVSMIGQLSTPNVNNYTNTIRNQPSTTGSYNKVEVSAIDKTGIYGYSFNSSLKCSIINDILGDKQDYSVPLTTQVENISAKYLVQGWIDINGLAVELSSVAWYWTIIANKVLTTDEINQVIAYFNLDRTLKPDILCNTIKQGITNENHAEFGDKLIDYSGNGRDIQLNNIAWKGDSGIGKYNYTYNDRIKTYNQCQANGYNTLINPTRQAVNGDLSFTISGSYKETVFVEIGEEAADGKFAFTKYSNGTFTHKMKDTTQYVWFRLHNISTDVNIGELTVEFIPSHAGALCLDGVNDYGKVTGLPIYKDYTVIADYIRTFAKENVRNAPILSKSKKGDDGAFIFNYVKYSTSDTLAYDTLAYSFASINNVSYINDFERNIYYQSKYTNNGNSINAGKGVDTDGMWLGTIRDNEYRFFNGAIYSLMTFPYSMSEFLIERQLKKHKLGTLYPDMVEFRPVIKANDNYKIFYTAMLPLTGDIWERINIGDYVPVGRRIAIQMSFDNEAKKLVSAVSSQLGNITIIKNSNNIGYTIFGDVLKDKSPQKISITIEQDENYVLFNPVINSNYDNYKLTFHLREYEKLINIGDYIPKGTYIRANLYLKNNIDELVTFTFNGVNIDYAKSPVLDTAYNIRQIYNYDSPQEVNITIDEYIRYEDIAQPYPVLLRFNDENGNEVSWGGKLRVGSTITRIGSAADSNLLPNIYNIFGLLLNDNQVTSSKVIVEKTMVFKAKSAYIFDNNEPNCILSPRLLRIPNSSYKILGYIPDISGHGNHGVIHNSAYGEGSGVNEDGSYQFDGVDDFVTIPTVTGGGKQVLMKVNNNTINSMLYDQRSSGASPNSLYDDFAIYCTNSADNNQIAYQSRLVGNTYIDGILNTNITCEDLLGVLHNITITCDIVAPNNGVVPNIGREGVLKNLYSNMALYDFMLFDNISTDDKIKQLNEYVGIEAKVELPPYYWDAYGKTNFDVDKATIQQRGVAEGDYDITNYNHAYDKMSGYGGYNLGRFDKSWAGSSSSNTSIKVVQRNPYDITLKKLGGNNDWEFNNTELKVISNPVSVKFKSNKNIRVTSDYHYYPVGGNSEGTPLGITSKDLIANKDAIITISSISQENIDKYNIDVNRGYYIIYFQLSSTLAVNEEVTIEMLPLYPNGLVCDGVTDYSENANIPALTDYTYILKRQILKGIANSAVMYKGNITVNQGGAFICNYCEPSDTNLFTDFSFGGLLRSNDIDKPIIYGTKTSVNGDSITPGENIDTVGINVGKWVNYLPMVFYKLILYPKTIPLLQINFLKNLMEKDEIIDLNNPIFIQE